LTYEIKIPHRVTRYVSRLQPRLRDQFLARFEQLSIDPFDPGVSEPLHGIHAGRRKSRVGDFRIIFDVRDEELIVFIVRVGPRGDVYKD